MEKKKILVTGSKGLSVARHEGFSSILAKSE